MNFIDVVMEVHLALQRANLPHAFGGALALGFITHPRGTIDIDVNVFVDPAAMPPVSEALAGLGLHPPADFDPFELGGVRYSGPALLYPVDVFPSLHSNYRSVMEGCQFHAFGESGVALPFLRAEDLCVFKLSFGRPQDWVDLASICRACADLDLDYIEAQLLAFRGEIMFPRIARLRALHRTR